MESSRSLLVDVSFLPNHAITFVLLVAYSLNFAETIAIITTIGNRTCGCRCRGFYPRRGHRWSRRGRHSRDKESQSSWLGLQQTLQLSQQGLCQHLSSSSRKSLAGHASKQVYMPEEDRPKEIPRPKGGSPWLLLDQHSLQTHTTVAVELASLPERFSRTWVFLAEPTNR